MIKIVFLFLIAVNSRKCSILTNVNPDPSIITPSMKIDDKIFHGDITFFSQYITFVINMKERSNSPLKYAILFIKLNSATTDDNSKRYTSNVLSKNSSMFLYPWFNILNSRIDWKQNPKLPIPHTEFHIFYDFHFQSIIGADVITTGDMSWIWTCRQISSLKKMHISHSV